ncbi:MAG: ABC transporter ATP-binding protein, partial [Candidatus Rokuibacteriota bacterium]
GLVGPNGAGKTTTLRCLTGILRPTAGSIRIAGADLLADPLTAKRALAFVPDEPALFEQLTVEEHLRLIGRLYGVPVEDAVLAQLLAEMELADRRTAFPAELSRGMKQKLAIACALVHRPSVLLLDEPLTGLDPLAIRRMKQTILSIAAQGAAVLLSSHLLPLVEQLCSRVLILREGCIVADGTVADLLARATGTGPRTLEDAFISLMEPPGRES